MEELWAEEASDETSGVTRKPRRNRNIIRRARNVSSDFPSLRSAQGDEKPGNVDSGRASIGVPKPPWEGEAPVSAESLQESDVSAARPSIISRRPAATAIRKLRIFSNRGGRDAAALATAFAAPAGSSATCAATSPRAGNGVAAEEVEGISAQLSRGTRDRLTAKSAGGGGTILKSSPQRRRGRAGGAVRRRIRRSFSEELAATVVPFVRREDDERQESQRPSRESSQPSHIMRSLSSGDGRQEAAGQENAAALCAPQRSDDASETTKRSGETGGEESRWRNGGQRAASYHEELASDLVDYFGEIAQSWSIESSNCECDSVGHPREAEAGEIAQSWGIEGSSRECDSAVGAEAVGAVVNRRLGRRNREWGGMDEQKERKGWDERREWRREG
ncbi:unnamed protein product [Closterium sp. Yama58-4]|nr:unnamed protein product [Closterium sp. Yama58-4]